MRACPLGRYRGRAYWEVQACTWWAAVKCFSSVIFGWRSIRLPRTFARRARSWLLLASALMIESQCFYSFSSLPSSPDHRVRRYPSSECAKKKEEEGSLRRKVLRSPFLGRPGESGGGDRGLEGGGGQPARRGFGPILERRLRQEAAAGGCGRRLRQEAAEGG